VGKGDRVPEHLTEKDKTPAPLAQVNMRIGIGWMGGKTVRAGGPGNSWEESPETDWRTVVREQIYRGPKGPTADYRRLGSEQYPARWEEMGWDERDERFRVIVQVHGINLLRARFMLSRQGYHRPEGSDSAVYTRLTGGTVFVLSTHQDIIEGQLEIPRFPRPVFLIPFCLPRLSEYDPTKMGVSVLNNNLIVIGYGKLPS